MSRVVPSSILTALGQSNVELFYAIEFDFDSAPLRFWTGLGNKTINGNTYLGAGTLISISGLEEVADLSAKSVTVGLSGVPVEVVSLAMQEPYQYRKCRIYFGVVGSDDVVEVFSGITNQMTIEDSADSAVITVTGESKLIQLEKASNRRYTSESHKSRYPSDTFFDYVTAIQDAEILWGKTSTN